MNSNVNTSFRHSKNECTHTFELKVTLCYYYTVPFQNRFTSGTLGPLFFLIYVNNMPNGLTGNVKLFVDDTYIFSIIKNKNNSAKDLTHDLSIISK